ncbi:MAG: antitoxin [Spirochaetaceae bacterium]
MKDPFKPLDEYERELMEYTESANFVPVENEAEQLDLFQQVAKNTAKKDQRMNIRVTKRDMEGIKAIALQEGLPYQTLVASLIHKYVLTNLNKQIS